MPKTTEKSHKTKKINVYGKQTYYMRNKSDSNKHLITQLTTTLKENQWIKVSGDKYKPINHNIDKLKSYYKPSGTYYSKGGWLFHEVCCDLDKEIILIDVDYSDIYRITGKTPYTQTNSNSVYKQNMNQFIESYGSKMDKYWCRTNNKFSNSININNTNINSTKITKKKTNKKQKNCYNYRNKNKCLSNKKCEWAKMFRTFNYPYKKYSGIAIYPLPSYKWLHTKFNERLIFNSFDVETLVLWNHKPVIKHYNLGTIREIIGKLDNINNNKISEDFTKYLIPKLIEIINKINNNKY